MILHESYTTIGTSPIALDVLPWTILLNYGLSSAAWESVVRSHTYHLLTSSADHDGDAVVCWAQSGRHRAISNASARRTVRIKRDELMLPRDVSDDMVRRERSIAAERRSGDLD